jgi:DNA helicase-2/ATP-dependent DNA helicase PcrA
MTKEVVQSFAIDDAALRDELDILAEFSERLAPGADHQNMVLGELAGDGVYVDRLTLSTLHSAKGREFGIVFMFGMDNGRILRNGASNNERAEARRLFYVGMT